MKRLYRFFGASMLFYVYCTHASAALYAIKKPEFSSFVDSRNYSTSNPASEDMISRADLPRGLLYFSVVIIGDERTIAHLHENRHLELNASIWCDGQRTDTVPIGITTQQWERNEDELRHELDSMDFFTWRTYLSTRKIHCSTVEILLRDDHNDVVAPVGHVGTYVSKVEIRP